MKKRFFVISLSLFAFSGYSFADGPNGSIDPKHSVNPATFNIKLNELQDSQKIRVTFEKQVDRSLVVTLKDPNGDELITYMVKAKATVIYQDINFKDADYGVYQLEISDKGNKVIKQINFQRVRSAATERLFVD
jgi:hypothetical protein